MTREYGGLICRDTYRVVVCLIIVNLFSFAHSHQISVVIWDSYTCIAFYESQPTSVWNQAFWVHNHADGGMDQLKGHLHVDIKFGFKYKGFSISTDFTLIVSI